MSIASHIPQRIAAFMPRQNILIPTLCIVSLVVVWCLRIPSSSLVWTSSNGAQQVPVLHQPPPHSDVDLSDPDAPFVGWPLRRVCDETTWVDGLVYICDNNSGGIGNVRNYIQTCLRYAIEAGATGLVVPKIRKRSEADLADLFTSYLPLSYMFDEEHFRDAWQTYCPRMKLYNDVIDVPNYPKNLDGKPRIEEIAPKDYGDRKGCDWKDQNRHTDRFGDTFRSWLGNVTNATPPSREHPRLIRFKWGVLWDWQIWKDGPEFATTFGHVLKFNSQLQHLGRTALANMRSFARSQGAPGGEFLGVHLRTENDAMNFWPVYDVQAQGYLRKAQEGKFKSSYLATGNITEAYKFEKQAMEVAKMKVLTKRDLLTGKDLEALNALTWDQQGLVDFIVLLGSTYFVGTMPSSFSVYMTLKRHLKTGGLYTRPYKAGTDGDGYSYLVGRYEQYWEDWLFMFDGMWP
ncbi:hypothetical protein PFICI_04831 [Pestalotiopsis fici W106-1]|uniref:Alternative oxidase n=1 Tax=Pestalotiopsis fici (strain W106-1 / CGMCC3.15140) TaxID=1229662 RepID=W3XA71_PESFW|nr:uncharacterized protein PFICI_04831 [Pestalotiopsis fici W106-1]ETS82955.1 hypothetical protein PFICI_04831 [Pestalotiopsis fici W106-1]